MPILANTRKKVSNAFSRLFTRKTNGLQKPKLRIKIPPNPNEFRRGNLQNYVEPEPNNEYKNIIAYPENENEYKISYTNNNLPELLASAENAEYYNSSLPLYNTNGSPSSNPQEVNSGSNRSSRKHHHRHHHHRHHSHRHRHHSHKHRNNNNNGHRHHSHKHKHHNHRRNK
jgi:hypothetical protein